jgi:MFS family permease
MIRNVSISSDGGQVGGRRARRWLVLAAGTVALTAGSAFQYGLAYLIPALRASGLSLAQAGVIVACPTAGLLLTLVAWGAAADRWGERRILATGLGVAGVVLLAAARARSPAALGACLVVAGAAGASVYAASGRLILGWFAARERGLAMGIRQSAQPLGVAVAALALPTLATRGLAAAFAFLSGFCLVAAALVVASRSAAQARGLKPLARVVSWGIAGVPPEIMGIGPVPASRQALAAAGLGLRDIDLVEVNEAFAGQYLAVEKELGLEREKTNVNGGAIALGHPLAATGTRLILTLLYELRRRKKRWGVASACIGGGQGIAIVVESIP